MTLSIERKNNGFILTITTEGEDGEYESVWVYEDVDNGLSGADEANAFVKMMWDLTEELGVSNSKHNKWLLRMDIIAQGEDDD